MRRSMMIGLVVAAGLSSVPTGAIATTRAADQGALGRPARVVAVVGDSLTRQSTPEIEQRLAAGGYTAAVASEPGHGLDTEAIQADLDRAAERRADVVVIATAANDAVTEAGVAAASGQHAAETTYRAEVAAVAARFPGQCVVLVNARPAVAPAYHPDQAALLNDHLRATVGLHDNLLVADWAAASADLPAAWFAADGLHVGPDPTSAAGTFPSAAAYADTIVAAVDRCGR